MLNAQAKYATHAKTKRLRRNNLLPFHPTMAEEGQLDRYLLSHHSLPNQQGVHLLAVQFVVCVLQCQNRGWGEMRSRYLHTSSTFYLVELRAKSLTSSSSCSTLRSALFMLSSLLPAPAEQEHLHRRRLRLETHHAIIITTITICVIVGALRISNSGHIVVHRIFHSRLAFEYKNLTILADRSG